MLTYNGIDTGSLMKVLKVTRSVLPPSEVKTLTIDGKAGGIFISKKDGMKRIEVEVLVLAEDPVSLRAKVRELADVLDADKPQSLTISDEPHLTDFGIIEGDTDIEEELKHGTGTISFLCPDPYSIGAERTVALTANGTTTVNNAGTAPSFPVITATATQDIGYFHISRGDDFGNDEFVEVGHSFVTGDVLEVDMSKGKVSINGEVRMAPLTLTSDFWSLSKRTNYIWCSAGFTIQLKYNERFK
ncbi:tail family protein [Bacillus phage PK2]|nr:tail family protein [Bacillus phage PK2]